MTLRFLATRASAILPITMSAAAFAVVAIPLLLGASSTPDGDEGTAAHLWQLLMAGQVPVIIYFALCWLPSAPREGLVVLVAQIGAGLAAAAPVFALHL